MSVDIRRDDYGVAHVQAADEDGAWFGQGWAAAEDRLWQMEYDRRRARGRWAEAAGPAGLAADTIARRLDLSTTARADLALMSRETLRMFEAYAGGVNAYVASGRALPPEYALTGITPEPWEPLDSVLVFKIRHILMGQWQLKVALGSLLARLGPERFQRLRFVPPARSSVILPPGARITQAYVAAERDLRAAAEHLGFLSEIDGGSNSWAVHGSRTTTGLPVICNDSHRALDVPNAYWQVRVSCAAFDVSGATFAGFPGFPHFGFNGHVAWNITHTQADYQDLYIERFEGPGSDRYLTPRGWAESEARSELIRVRGASPVAIRAWRTRHGPVVHREAASEYGLALRYTAHDGGRPGFEALRPMLTAHTVPELFDHQRTWVDPVNNLVAADRSGNIGYLVRGELPVRSSAAARLVPAPGWTGQHEWTGAVPFDRLPRSVNPPEGYIATANQRVLDSDDPYISETYAPPARADRLVELLRDTGNLEPATIASWQGDRVSLPGRTWARMLAGLGPFEGDAEAARTMLAGWDGNLLPDRPEGVLYACFRRDVARRVLEPLLGPGTWDWLTQDANAGGARVIGGLLSNVVASIAAGEGPPGGEPWATVVAPALAGAWATAVAAHGVDPATWQWGRRHTTGSRHPLSGVFPGANLDPPRVSCGGDADTLQAAGYGWSGRNDFLLASTSVYRQVVDFADPGGASFVIPGGASGDPSSPHFADQLPLWQRHERIPMR